MACWPAVARLSKQPRPAGARVLPPDRPFMGRRSHSPGPECLGFCMPHRGTQKESGSGRCGESLVGRVWMALRRAWKASGRREGGQQPGGACSVKLKQRACGPLKSRMRSCAHGLMKVAFCSEWTLSERGLGSVNQGLKACIAPVRQGGAGRFHRSQTLCSRTGGSNDRSCACVA